MASILLHKITNPLLVGLLGVKGVLAENTLMGRVLRENATATLPVYLSPQWSRISTLNPEQCHHWFGEDPDWFEITLGCWSTWDLNSCHTKPALLCSTKGLSCDIRLEFQTPVRASVACCCGMEWVNHCPRLLTPSPEALAQHKIITTHACYIQLPCNMRALCGHGSAYQTSCTNQ